MGKLRRGKPTHTATEFIMKINQLKWPATLLALAAGMSFALAAEPTLKVGDAAPKLVNGKYVQGEAVKEFQPGKAYVVEFWATWCGPCRASIPHLNETYMKFKDKGLIVIGQDCWEDDEGKVEPFIKTMGDKMTYRVALDDKTGSEKGQMADTWMAAAGQNGIPTAFLVDTTGHIAWIGHPMTLKEQVIDDVIAGKYDLKKAAADSAREKENEAKLNETGHALEEAMQKKDWDTASAKADEIEKLLPEDERDMLGMLRFGILAGKKDYTAAYKLAAQISDTHKDNATLQNQLAWQIVSDDTLEQRDLKVAETLATRANDASGGKDAGIIDTLARVKFMQGKKDEAITLQEKAVNLVEGNDKTMLQGTLDSYKKGELPKAN
jgi:thiol-disulfide isomerase/thioredoxin